MRLVIIVVVHRVINVHSVLQVGFYNLVFVKQIVEMEITDIQPKIFAMAAILHV